MKNRQLIIIIISFLSCLVFGNSQLYATHPIDIKKSILQSNELEINKDFRLVIKKKSKLSKVKQRISTFSKKFKQAFVDSKNKYLFLSFLFSGLGMILIGCLLYVVSNETSFALRNGATVSWILFSLGFMMVGGVYFLIWLFSL